MTLYLFGNPDAPFDSIPVKLLKELERKFPSIQFIQKDPNEEWEISGDDITIIDTVFGIAKVTVFDSLDAFSSPPHTTLNDFDAYSNLRFLQKLGKLKKIKIIGIPSHYADDDALHSMSALLSDKALVFKEGAS